MGIRIVSHPHYFFVRRLRPRQPLPVHVVPPKKMIGDDRPSGMNDRYYAIKGKGLVTL
jgi:hypothetical protein